MSVAKIIEIDSSSKKSFEDAIQKGVKKAAESVSNITGAWVNEQKVVIKNDEIVLWRVNMKVSFVLK
ncbi:MAG: dodecin family protein [Planctomycetota bacterium]